MYLGAKFQENWLRNAPEKALQKYTQTKCQKVQLNLTFLFAQSTKQEITYKMKLTYM